MARGRGKRLFQTFSSKGGDYSREAINRGTAISKEILYVRAGTPELLDMSASSKRLFYFAGLFNNLLNYARYAVYYMKRVASQSGGLRLIVKTTSLAFCAT